MQKMMKKYGNLGERSFALGSHLTQWTSGPEGVSHFVF